MGFDNRPLGKYSQEYGMVCSFICDPKHWCGKDGKYQGWCDRKFPKQKRVTPSFGTYCGRMDNICQGWTQRGYNDMMDQMTDWFQNESSITGDVGVSFYYETMVNFVNTHFTTDSQYL